MSKVAVFMPVHNEEAYIEKTVASVLAQDYGNLDLLISENHSTDSTRDIVHALSEQDSRIKVFRPEAKLNGYGNFCFLAEHVNSGRYYASMMLGGHDLLSQNALSSLMNHLLSYDDCAVAYQRSTFEIDEQDNLTRRWPTCHQSGFLDAGFDSLFTLLTLVYNTPIFGLWRQSVRKRTTYRYPCVGGDHLYVAEAALHGSITAVDGGEMYLRRSPVTANYLQKHFTDRSGDNAAAEDMYVQLRWLSAILDSGTSSYPPNAREMLRSSAIALYLLRYNHHFGTFGSNFNAFVARSDIEPFIQAKVTLGANLNELLKAKLSAIPSDPSEGGER